jgi:hypothetical protein
MYDGDVVFTSDDGLLNYRGAIYGIYFDYGDSPNPFVQSGWMASGRGHELFSTHEDAEIFAKLNRNNLLFDNLVAQIKALPSHWKSVIPKWCIITPIGDDPYGMVECWEVIEIDGVKQSRSLGNLYETDGNLSDYK